jgi:hypothetical protein
MKNVPKLVPSYPNVENLLEPPVHDDWLCIYHSSTLISLNLK